MDINEIIKRYEEHQTQKSIAQEAGYDTVYKLHKEITRYYRENNKEDPIEKKRKENRIAKKNLINDIEKIYERMKDGEKPNNSAKEYNVDTYNK